MTTSTKLSPHTTWLFAFGAIAVGIGASYATAGLGQKVAAAVYFAVVAVAGFASTYFTRARVRGAVLSFLTAATVAAVAYFFLVDALFSGATTAVADATQTGVEHAATVDAGAKMGKIFGIFVAAVVFLETAVAGIGGAIAGDKSRGKDGATASRSLARSAG